MSDKPSQKRKRGAATDLRALAGELQLNDRGRNADLNATGFSNLFRPVVASCTTPEQKRRAQGARDLNDFRSVPHEAVKILNRAATLQ